MPPSYNPVLTLTGKDGGHMRLPKGFVYDDSRDKEMIAGLEFIPVRMSLRNNIHAFITGGVVGNCIVHGYVNPLKLFYNNGKASE